MEALSLNGRPLQERLATATCIARARAPFILQPLCSSPHSPATQRGRLVERACCCSSRRLSSQCRSSRCQPLRRCSKRPPVRPWIACDPRGFNSPEARTQASCVHCMMRIESTARSTQAIQAGVGLGASLRRWPKRRALLSAARSCSRFGRPVAGGLERRGAMCTPSGWEMAGSRINE